MNIKLLFCASLLAFYFPANSQSNTSGAKEPLTMAAITAAGREYDPLKTLIGKWNVEQKNWNDSSASPFITAHYVAERTMQDHFVEEVMQPAAGAKDKAFKRMSYFNFNYANYQWEYIVLDTRYPVMMFETSTEKMKDDKTLTLYLPSFVLPPGWVDKNGGSLTKQRRVISFETADRTVMKQYWTLPGGREFLAVQYTYTRMQIAAGR